MTFKTRTTWMLLTFTILGFGILGYGQQLVREYVRLGSRVIAIENTCPSGVCVQAIPAAGSSSTFTIQVHNDAGAQTSQVWFLINYLGLNGAAACYFSYIPGSNALYLMNDAGGAWLGPVPLSSASSLYNSQCFLTSASASTSGSTFTMVVNIGFYPAFGGTKVLFASAQRTSGQSTAWFAAGSFTVLPVSYPPGASVIGMNPSTGIGSNQAFTFTFGDTSGWQNQDIVNVLVNNDLNGNHACYVAFVVPSQQVFLVRDVPDQYQTYAGSFTMPSSATVANSQCAINGTGSSYSISGNLMTLMLNTTFLPAFAGSRIFYLDARDETTLSNSGWQSAGSWIVQ